MDDYIEDLEALIEEQSQEINSLLSVLEKILPAAGKDKLGLLATLMKREKIDSYLDDPESGWVLDKVVESVAEHSRIYKKPTARSYKYIVINEKQPDYKITMDYMGAVKTIVDDSIAEKGQEGIMVIMDLIKGRVS